MKWVLTKPNRHGYIRAYYRYVFRGKELKLYLGESFHPKFWDQRRQRFKPATPGAGQLNMMLEKIETDLMFDIRQLKLENKLPSVDNIKARRAPAQLKEPLLTEAFRDFLTAKRLTLKAETMRAYEALYRLLQEWESYNQPVKVAELSQEILQKWHHFFIQEKQNSQLTANRKFNKLEQFHQWLKENDYTVPNLNFKNLQFKKVFSKQQIALTETELVLIEKHIPATPVQQKIKAAFLLQCYTGLRFSDILRLQKGHIEENKTGKWINLLTQKTGSEVKIPLSPKAEFIIEEYQHDFSNLAQQTVNRYLKSIARDAGITEKIKYRTNSGEEEWAEKWKLVTSHTGRRTFITHCLNAGMRIEIVKKMVGHSNIDMTVHYAKTDETEILKDFEKKKPAN